QRFTKIAIADDHAILRKGLINILGFYKDIQVVAEAENGAELLDKLKAEEEELPEVIILDINMPVMDGFSAAKAIRKSWPEIKILALSMYDNEENIIKMLRCGANGYVLKDIDPKDLYQAILHLRNHDFYYSEQVTGKLLHKIQQTEDERQNLTERELEFLQNCCSEMTYKEIAEKMFVSPRTVDGYRESLFQKLNISSRV